MHTLTELCFDMNISQGSRSRAVRAFERLYGIVGIKRKIEGKRGYRWITFTDAQYNLIITEWPKRNKKGRPRNDAKPKVKHNKRIIAKTSIEDGLRSYTTSEKPSENRSESLYMRISPLWEINTFQGAV